MGKVKSAERDKYVARFTYQFPMGKVKFTVRFYMKQRLNHVSIPYGKGKVVASIEISKENKEKKVSIPYGKGKEQHFVLRFYYNP